MTFLYKSQNYSRKICTTIFILFSVIEFVNAQNKPNVIFILADDVGYNLLSVNGSKTYSTPNLDSMARHGMNFTHCESTPLCSPSRCMLLTGKYNFRNYSDWSYISDTAKTFGNVMHDAGYKTGFFGKLQLQFSNSLMANWGFDKYSVFELSDDTIRTRRYKSPTLVNNYGLLPDSIVQNKYCDDILTDEISSFIDSSHNQPFFVYYSMSLLHEPFTPTPFDSAYKNWNPDNKTSDTSFFHSMLKYLDYKVGVVINSLAKKGLDKNTIVIFCGDNGTPSGVYYDVDSLAVEGGKSSTTESGTHVPMIAYWPGHINQGKTNDDLIDFTDFLSTFADISGNHNLSKFGKLDGLSFYSRLLGVEDTAKSQLFFHYCSNPGLEKLYRWVRDKNYKLYDKTNNNSYQFYNIKSDVNEAKPLNDSELTTEEKNIKKRFKNILDSMPDWDNRPVVKNAFVTDITSNSATINATITNSGSSDLIERGTNLMDVNDVPYYGQNKLADSIIAIGSFSQKRTKLVSQFEYAYTAYAKNSDQSNSTGYARGTFYTLSLPPVAQPTNLKACVDSTNITLSWNGAVFPVIGAAKRGYALYFSTDSIQLIDKPNGNNPSIINKNGNFIPVSIKVQPNMPDTFVRISNIDTKLSYHFLLIPYTRNITTDSTCNYLTQDALTIITKPFKEHMSINLTQNSGCFGINNASIMVQAINGMSPYKYCINSGVYTNDSIFNNLSAGSYEVKTKDNEGCYDSVLTIIQSPTQLILISKSEDVSCTEKGTIKLTAKGGTPPYLYSFGNSVFDTVSYFKNLSAGVYSFSLQDANKCIVSSSETILPITVNCFFDIKISPNPSSNYFNLLIGSTRLSDVIKIRVYDAAGKQVYTTYGSQISSYKFGNAFAKGVYLVRVESGNDTFKFRIIKN